MVIKKAFRGFLWISIGVLKILSRKFWAGGVVEYMPAQKGNVEGLQALSTSGITLNDDRPCRIGWVVLVEALDELHGGKGAG